MFSNHFHSTVKDSQLDISILIFLDYGLILLI